MKYLREFQTRSEYDSFIASTVDYPNVCLIAEDNAVAYNPPIPPLYIEAIEDIDIQFGNTYEYSKDNTTWEIGTSETAISAIKGEKVYFRSSGITADHNEGIGTFIVSNGKCNVGGNIMSMAYGADFEGKTEITQKYQFYQLFYQATQIVDTSRLVLPATTLAKYCYCNMFYGCTSLVNAPALPATTLASNCYSDMFEGCTSLVNAPALPATTLANACYHAMFSGCTNLSEAPALPATTLVNYCYEFMFQDCTSLVDAPALPATKLSGYCYYFMFDGCTSLCNAPELPATSLSGHCYHAMFMNCTSLFTAPVLPATTLVNYCYQAMFWGCTSLSDIKAMFTTAPGSGFTDGWLTYVAQSGTFVKNSAATWENTFGTSAIPSGWTVEYADA